MELVSGTANSHSKTGHQDINSASITSQMTTEGERDSSSERHQPYIKLDIDTTRDSPEKAVRALLQEPKYRAKRKIATSVEQNLSIYYSSLDRLGPQYNKIGSRFRTSADTEILCECGFLERSGIRSRENWAL